MMSMPERSNGQVSSAVEKRLEEGDHAQQKAGMEAASPRRYLVASPRERAVHLFIGQYLRSRAFGVQISCQACTAWAK